MADVLIVDDEEDICEMLCDEVRQLELKADYAMTGEIAVKKIEAEDWKIGVIDLKLATAVTGLDVIKAFKTVRPNAKVLAMTGYIDIGLKQETEKLGANGYLVKPDDIQPETFQRHIRRLLLR